ncbi:MAG: radical SAM protein [Syntrophobacter sp.]
MEKTPGPLIRTSSHPCFNERAKDFFGRAHLPVAPGCNIQCRYCNRVYDCVNESRPGVTSKVFSPEEASEYLDRLLARMPWIAVAGIAGPGDAFHDPERTLTTLEMIRRTHPELNLCISTNGLNIAPYVGELSRLGVGYVTVTVNAVSPRIGALIYDYAMDGSNWIDGIDAAGLLLDRQMEAVRALKGSGMTVKVNTVVIPDVNDQHVTEIAKLVSALGADIMNIIGIIPVPGTSFEHIRPLTADFLKELRQSAGHYLPQMSHCVRCRSDAVGLLRCSSSGRSCGSGRDHDAPHGTGKVLAGF